ncbi:MAG: GNAT family N-acetyltransferase [Candidatus Hydrogenedentes bacterium]|nr:GNAT family N-acetyltransferase [Candidatus Hydrogenedentota bacterium]
MAAFEYHHRWPEHEPARSGNQVRRATAQDAEGLCHLLCACYEDFARTDDFSRDVVEALKETRGSLACVLEDIATQHVFVAEGESRIKGMVSVRGNEITRLYVCPQYQRMGLGSLLFTFAEAFAREGGHLRLFLGAAGRSMLPFYVKMGMRIDHERKIASGPCAGMTVLVLVKGVGP